MTRAKVKAGGIVRKAIDSTWRTPEALRARIRAYFSGVDFLDPCAPPDNPLGAARYYCGPVPGGVPTRGPLFGEATQEEANRLDGLAEPWDLPWYANIPFNAAAEWSPKIVREVEARPAQPGLLLLPVNRTEETFIHDLLDRSWRFLLVRWPDKKARHRIPFESSIDGVPCRNNPFASWLIGFGGEPAKGRWLAAFGDLGASYRVERVEAEPWWSGQVPCDCEDCDGTWCVWCLDHHGGRPCPVEEEIRQSAPRVHRGERA